jgi:2-polyprenyl-3-methyl-5-hydroxy-6-metoxy-1,4-benzoquinol methylase/glycosyltransferase involved in cell wall biosynthesis
VAQDSPLTVGFDPVDLLRCPSCLGRLEPGDGRLRCRGDCGRSYAVADSIPRFATDLDEGVAQVQRVFDFEHRRYERSAWTRFEPDLVDRFLNDCRLRRSFFRGKTVLDAGCGSGRWTYALAHLGANVMAIDLTLGGVESARAALSDLPVGFAQASIFEPPFEPETFDFVMSWGVLHHTPDTRAAFSRLVPLVRPGGTLYVMVYEKQPSLRWYGTESLRFVLRQLSDEQRYAFCRHLVLNARHPYRFAALSRLFMVAAYDPLTSPVDPETYQFGLFDAYSPKYNHVHTREEVATWFRESGFEPVTVVDSVPGAVKVRGVKAPSRTRTRPLSVVPLRGTEQSTVTRPAWVDAFTEQNGRAPRVLHLGNIANNGYINAKIQRQVGIEADVASCDYYHVMGTPEWEDAEFRGNVDEAHPNWSRVDLGGWERPRWFVQGSTRSCVRYLQALHSGSRELAERRWRALGREQTRAARRASAMRRLGWHVHGSVIMRKTAGSARALKAMANGVPPRRAFARHVFPTRMADALEPEDLTVFASGGGRAGVAGGADRWVARFAELFPDREDALTPADLVEAGSAAARWRDVFAHYDIVQAYATNPIVPLLAGVRAFTAYEHGTLRELPFEVSARGRTLALGYAEAPVVFVTNADDLDAAARLGIPEERVVALPHAVDTARLFAYAAEHAELAPGPDVQMTFFAPARHDWTDGPRSQLKGNDRIVRAVRTLRDRGHELHVVLVDWGRDTAATRALIAELDCGDSFDWISPLGKRALWARYLSSHAVLDQFVMEAIGSVTFEALALGRRVITGLDRDVNARFFGEAPPVLVASETEEIADAMELVIADPQDDGERGAAARAWTERYHSSERILGLQAEAYERVLASARIS